MSTDTRHLPIVMIHGMHSRDKNLTHSDLWGRIPDWLGDRGFSVWYGNEDAYGAVTRNACEIAKSIHIVRDRTGADRVHVVAHSKGGLDAYHVAALPEMEGKIASVLTLSAPIQGMKVVNFLAKFAPLLKVTLARYYDAKARRLGDIAPNSLELLRSVTTKRCETFLAEHPQVPGITYRSLVFVPHPKPFHGLSLMKIFIQLFDGLNDGVAPMWSMEYPPYRIFDAEPGAPFRHDDSCDLFHRDIAITSRDDGRTYPSVAALLCEQMEDLDALAVQKRS